MDIIGISKKPPFDLTERKSRDKRKKLWSFLMDAYIGGFDYTEKKEYLIGGVGEYPEEYNARKKLASYFNAPKNVINNLEKHIFEKEIDRDTIVDLTNMMGFREIRGKHTDVDNYFGLIQRLKWIYGEIYLLIEGSQGTEELTDLELVELGKTMYTTPVLPHQVYHITTDKGDIKKIIIDTNFEFQGETILQVYYDPGIIGFNLKGKDPVTRENVFGRVPILQLIIDEDKDGFGEGLLRDIAKHANVIYNKANMITGIELSNVAPTITLPVDDKGNKTFRESYGLIKAPEKSPDILGETKEPEKLGNTNLVARAIKWVIDFRKKRVMTHSPGNAPQLLVVDISVVDRIQADVDKMKAEIQEMANQRIQEIIRQSGISKSYDFKDTSAQLQYLSKIARMDELEFWKLFLQLTFNKSKKLEDIFLGYPETFDVIDKDILTQRLISIRETILSAGGKQEIDKYLVDLALKGHAKPSTINDIKKGIDDTDYTKELSLSTPIIPDLEGGSDDDLTNFRNNFT